MLDNKMLELELSTQANVTHASWPRQRVTYFINEYHKLLTNQSNSTHFNNEQKENNTSEFSRSGLSKLQKYFFYKKKNW